jgi:hypothetical protein
MRSKRCLFFLLDFVLSVGNLMFPIANLMVDGGCIATTGGSSLFRRGFAITGGSYAFMHSPWIVGLYYSYRMRCREQEYVGDNG